MVIIDFYEKVEAVSKRVDDQTESFSGQRDCENDVFIDTYKNMCHDIVECLNDSDLGYKAMISRAVHLAQPLGEVIKMWT